MATVVDEDTLEGGGVGHPWSRRTRSIVVAIAALLTLTALFGIYKHHQNTKIETWLVSESKFANWLRSHPSATELVDQYGTSRVGSTTVTQSQVAVRLAALLADTTGRRATTTGSRESGIKGLELDSQVRSGGCLTFVKLQQRTFPITTQGLQLPSDATVTRLSNGDFVVLSTSDDTSALGNVAARITSEGVVAVAGSMCPASPQSALQASVLDNLAQAATQLWAR